MAQDIEKGSALSTVYQSVYVTFSNGYVYTVDISQKVNSNKTENANVIYTVSFDTDGGTSIEPQSVPYNSLATEPTAPTKADYTFVGWYTDTSYTTVFDFSLPIIGDTVVYAKWEAGSQTDYKITITNADETYSANVTATPVVGNVETATLTFGDYIDLAQRIPAGASISTVYSSIVAEVNGTSLSYEVYQVPVSDVVWAVEYPTQYYTINMQNEDSEESCTVTAVLASDSSTETHIIAPNSTEPLTLTVEGGNTISSVYSSITATYLGTIDFNFDVSAVVNADVYLSSAIPHPQLTTTIRLMNNSNSQAFTYSATPVGGGTAETGTVNAGSNASLDIGLATGDAISTAYSAITVTYPGASPINADLTEVATGDTYLDLEFTDVEPETISLPQSLPISPYEWDETSAPGSFEMAPYVADASLKNQLSSLLLDVESQGGSLQGSWKVTQGNSEWMFDTATVTYDGYTLLTLSNSNSGNEIAFNMNLSSDVYFIDNASLGGSTLVTDSDPSESRESIVLSYPTSMFNGSKIKNYADALTDGADGFLTQADVPLVAYPCVIGITQDASNVTLTFTNGNIGDADYGNITFTAEYVAHEDDEGMYWRRSGYTRTGFDYVQDSEEEE